MERRWTKERWGFAAALVLVGLMAVPMQAKAYSRDDQRLFALNMYHEARSGGRDGMIAVGWVVLNRVKDKGFPNTIRGVILQGGPKPPCEWGWTCDRRKDAPAADKNWRLAQTLARQLLSSNRPADPIGGALWLHESWRKPPAYTATLHRTATIGDNVFYSR